ncbi:MAG: type IX secretion system plug protein domain-containing protein, partial [Chitinophagaceae bacterium]
NADWTPAMLSTFDFVKGYSQMRLSQYRISSLALTRYTHYQAVLPDRNCVPSRSGNYLLKVFLDGDTSKLVFTRALMVVDERSSLVAAIQQPYNGQVFRSHQKVQFKVNLNEQLNVVNPYQQVKVIILQNQRWDNALTHIRPTFFSRNQIEFNTEADCLLPGGKEWRWLDLRSFRYQSDRVLRAEYNRTSTDIFVKPDMDRSAQRFNFFRDNNGQYFIQCSESINPLWQGDYATVHFAFVPPNNLPLSGQDVYLFGQLSNYELNDAAKMTFNEENNVYEKTLVLKQGYYDYCYVTRDQQHPENPASFQFTEGDYWEAENTYILLLYYRPLAGRADELIGYAITNSRFGR